MNNCFKALSQKGQVANTDFDCFIHNDLYDIIIGFLGIRDHTADQNGMSLITTFTFETDDPYFISFIGWMNITLIIRMRNQFVFSTTWTGKLRMIN